MTKSNPKKPSKAKAKTSPKAKKSSYFGLLGIVIFLIAATVIYTGYWYYMAYYMDDYVEDFAKAQQSNGVNFEYEDLEVSGYPYRFSLNFKSPSISYIQGPYLVEFQSDTSSMVFQPWNLSHGIFLTGNSVLFLDNSKETLISLNPSASRTSIRFVDDQLYQVSSAFEGVELITANNTTFVSRSLGMHFRVADDRPSMRRKEANDLVEPKIADLVFLMNQFGRKGKGPKGDIELSLTPRGQFTPSLTSSTLEDWRNQGGTVDLNSLNITWQGRKITTEGGLSLDENYRVLAALTAKSPNAKTLTSFLRTMGWANSQERKEITTWVSVWGAKNRDNSGKINIPIMIQDGFVTIANASVGRLGPVIKP